MNIVKFSILLSRFAGAVLLIIALSYFIPLLPLTKLNSAATGGWTSYSPHDPTVTITGGGSYYSVFLAAEFGPPTFLAFFGALMIVCSAPIGRWLAKGLTDTVN